ncbi:MAG TPA: hypothetical protein VHT96_15540 [Clostridia bacterium]|nr:hypothetical protein [Clostridia bacterium]
MALNQEQKELQKELKTRADAFVSLCEKLPKDVVTAWFKLVGYIREYCYMDEEWDGKELIFCSEGRSFFKMVLTPDAVLTSFTDKNDESEIMELRSTESVDEIIAMIKIKQFPERVLPSDDIRVSSGGGRCDLCLHNSITLKKQDRRIEMALGFTKYFGDGGSHNEHVCRGNNADCLIHDIGRGTPGLTADEVTHIAFPYWWIKSSRNKDNALKIKPYLTNIANWNGIAPNTLQLPDCEILPASIKAIMINEVVPKNPDDWFYSEAHDPENRRSAFGLFERAGVSVKSMRDILNLGIYITTALKTPKVGYTPAPEVIKAQLPLLEAELALFPNLKVIMLMGDVAKKAVNMIVKEKTKQNVIPSKSTGSIRHNEYYWDAVRIFPSYIMTGKNLLIEKGKCDTIADDIRRMMEVVK